MIIVEKLQNNQNKNNNSKPNLEKISEIIKDKNMRNNNASYQYLSFERMPENMELVESFEIFTKNVSDSGIPVVNDVDNNGKLTISTFRGRTLTQNKIED